MASLDTWPCPADGSPISLESWVAAALFDDQRGYYSRRISTVGKGGDFSTSATLSPLLARAIAAWISDQPQRLPLIEIGAGDGSLARDIVAALPLIQRWRVEYHIVETSAPLRERQRKNAPRNTRWHDDLLHALAACRGRAHIFSNELVDAYPPRQFQLGPDGWSELYLRASTTKEVEEIWQPIPTSNLPPCSIFNQSFAPGQRVEVHDSYRRSLDDIAAIWSEGEMLTIDYGDTADRIYHRAPRGSMRGYFHHQLIDGPGLYTRAGHQDLTCDVNFTDLQQWGEALGWQTISYGTQAEFLQPHARGTTVDHYLLHPDGPGAAFKYLIQRS